MRAMSASGGRLLEAVAERALSRYLRRSGATGVMIIDENTDPARLGGVDLVYTRSGDTVRAKVKADAYFGTDRAKIADQSLTFYRETVRSYAFETISHHLTRDLGWIFNSMADEILYYYVAIAQSEDDVAALMQETDAVFFTELAVERDELHVLPMAPLRAWFEANHERYMPRPVTLGDHSAWFRIIPIADITAAIPSVQVRGQIFSSLADL